MLSTTAEYNPKQDRRVALQRGVKDAVNHAGLMGRGLITEPATPAVCAGHGMG